MFKVIREKIEDQLRKIHLQHASEKNGNIKATLNIGLFRYLRHEISEYALDLMATHAAGVNATTVLPQSTGVFRKTLGLPCKHQIQESFRHPNRPLQRDNLHPHWWLTPLGEEQPVESWARIQPPVRTRRRGRPRNSRREPSALEIAQTQAAARRTQNRVPGRGDRRRMRHEIGRRGGGQHGQGRNVGQAENGNRDCLYEDRPQRQGLRRRSQA